MATLIHPTAVIHPGAELHPTVSVGPYAVIGEKVKVGAETTIGAHVVLDGWTEIGERNQIFPGAAIGLEPQDRKYDGSSSQVKIGNDNKFREFVTVNRATRSGEATLIGNSNLLMAYAHVAHNCIVENHVTITNSVQIAGHVHIESGATIGGGCGVHQFVHIGRLAMIAGVSRVIRDVPPFMLAEGFPVRIRSLNRVGLERAGLVQVNSGRTYQILKKAFRILYRSNLNLNQALEQLELLPEDEYVQHLYRFLQLSQTEGRRGPTPGKKVKGGEE